MPSPNRRRRAKLFTKCGTCVEAQLEWVGAVEFQVRQIWFAPSAKLAARWGLRCANVWLAIEAQNRVCRLRNFFTTIHFTSLDIVLSCHIGRRYRTFESQTPAGGELANGSKWILTVLMALCIITRQSICRQKNNRNLATSDLRKSPFLSVSCRTWFAIKWKRICTTAYQVISHDAASAADRKRKSRRAQKNLPNFFVLRWNEITKSTEAGQGLRKSRYRCRS